MPLRTGFRVPSDPRELSRMNWTEDLFLALLTDYGDHDQVAMHPAPTHPARECGFGRSV
jgi:hypothetical protein